MTHYIVFLSMTVNGRKNWTNIDSITSFSNDCNPSLTNTSLDLS